MKIAVVFYSLNGSCALIAQEIKAKLDADLLRLHTEDETDPQGAPAQQLHEIFLGYRRYERDEKSPSQTLYF